MVITEKQKIANARTKHSWIPTGNLNEAKCCHCALVRIKGFHNRYLRNNQEVEQEGCINKK